MRYRIVNMQQIQTMPLRNLRHPRSESQRIRRIQKQWIIRNLYLVVINSRYIRIKPDRIRIADKMHFVASVRQFESKLGRHNPAAPISGVAGDSNPHLSSMRLALSPAKIPNPASRLIVRLQLMTLAWMLIECSVAIASAAKAHSPALLAFGTDSFVELLSALVVMLQFAPWFTLSPRRAARFAGILLSVLAVAVALLSTTALVTHARPDASPSGIAITVAALLLMPVLSRAKRKAARATGNRALAADAVQSATCAYLAAVTLIGLTLNAAFGIRWIDLVAALVAVPILALEAKRALQGEPCSCC